MAATASNNDMKKLLFLLVIIAFYAVTSMMTPPEGLTVAGWRSILLMICAVVVWVSEIIPLGISSCLFIFLPQFLHIDTTHFALQHFAIATIFFILSAVIIARVFIDTGLGHRISLYITCMFGSKSKMVLLSFMLCGALISTVMVDIPTAIILGGLALPILKQNNCLPGKSSFGRAIMIGIPVAAGVGGIATPAGSGLNVLAVNLIQKATGVEVTFLQWTAIGLPMAAVLVFIAWYLLTKIYPPEIERLEGLDDIVQKRNEFGPLSSDEKKFAIIFALVILLWVTQSLTHISTALSSLVGSCLFFLPGINLAKWDRAKESISWETLLLIGSSASLAMVLHHQGGAEWLSKMCLGGIDNVGLFTLLLAITAFGIFSHLLVPVASAMLVLAIPILANLGTQMGINPLYLAFPLGFTASAVFMLPLDPIPLTTYGFGYWRLWHMTIPGTVLSIIWIPVGAAMIFFGIQLGVI